MDVDMWDSTITQAQLCNSISRLQELAKVPAEPRENVLQPAPSSSHRLSVEREKEIVRNLAFLSATTDNHLQVMAVCIEEHPDGKGFTIRVASNSGDLVSVTRGFEGLARILEEAATRGWYKVNS